MQTKLPLISVIVPCHNCAKYIKEALNAMLSQTYKNLEIIIVDDNSTDKLTQTIKPYLQKYEHIKLYKLPTDDPNRYDNRGNNVNAGWMARNYGVSKANGDYITFQDADDGSFANRIEFQYQMLLTLKATHLNVNWQQFDSKLNCKKLRINYKKFKIIYPNQISRLANRTRRRFLTIPYAIITNPFLRVLKNLIDTYFPYDWTPYPLAASMPLVKKEVFAKCQFRPVHERVWPSQRGRGADRDFNFCVAETFNNSYAIEVPLILWRHHR